MIKYTKMVVYINYFVILFFLISIQLKQNNTMFSIRYIYDKEEKEISPKDYIVKKIIFEQESIKNCVNHEFYKILCKGG